MIVRALKHRLGIKMKIDRLIGILSILLQQEKTTAPKLAERFEVSRRTINRDVEALCLAGIPIRTEQGVNGGISIMEGFKMDRTLLTGEEMRAILSGLRNLDSLCGSSRHQQLMDKLSLENSHTLIADNHVLIDLSSWKMKHLGERVQYIRAAAENCNIVTFDYFTSEAGSERKVEPYLLIFRWQAWYVWGYCSMRKGFRLFKLGRMDNLQVLEERFEPRSLPELSEIPSEIYNPGSFCVTAAFSPDMKWRLLEEFGPDNIRVMEDGRLLLEFTWSDRDSLYSYLCGYRDHVELISPEQCRQEFRELIMRISNQYNT